MKTEVRIGGLVWKNPVSLMSGVGGFGEEVSGFYALAELGAFFTKCVTLRPRDGNPPPRVWETPAGMLNAIGLQNPGLDSFIGDKLPALRRSGANVIVNISGERIEDYAELAGRLEQAGGVDGIELNVSCPNVKRGGMEFGRDPATLGELVSAVGAASGLPLIVKLSPNVTDIAETATAAESAGAHGLTIMNTLQGMAVDIRTRRPRLGNLYGGLSGPAVRPVAVRMVHQAARAVSIPIIGVGGITTGDDAVEFLLAGAAAVGIGTAALVDPLAPIRVRDRIVEYMAEQGVDDINQLVGALEDF